MKRLIYFSLFMMILTSCNLTENPEPAISEIGIWEMTEVRSSWGFDPVSASNLEYKETYEFRNDGTFTKSNSEINQSLNGEYTIEEPEDVFADRVKSFLILTYNQEDLNALSEELEERNPDSTDVIPFFWIVYSNSQDTERLSLQHDGKLINAGYGVMDGPIFVYEK